jgi:hypothetical protein
VRLLGVSALIGLPMALVAQRAAQPLLTYADNSALVPIGAALSTCMFAALASLASTLALPPNLARDLTQD